MDQIYSILPPHGLALKLSPQNPSASPVLEVAPLSPIGNFLCKISPQENSLYASPVLAVAPLLHIENFSYVEFPYIEIPYRGKVAPVQF